MSQRLVPISLMKGIRTGGRFCQEEIGVARPVATSDFANIHAPKSAALGAGANSLSPPNTIL